MPEDRMQYVKYICPICGEVSKGIVGLSNDCPKCLVKHIGIEDDSKTTRATLEVYNKYKFIASTDYDRMLDKIKIQLELSHNVVEGKLLPDLKVDRVLSTDYKAADIVKAIGDAKYELYKRAVASMMDSLYWVINQDEKE